MDALSMNGKKLKVEIKVAGGESADTTLTYDTTVFVEDSSVVYTMSDPGVAEVDENGTVTPVGNGKTVLTATLLPSGTKADIPVTVKGISGTEPEPEPAPAITVEVSGDEGSVAVIAAQTEGETLTLNVEPISEDTLSETKKAAIEGLNVQTVFDIYLTSGDERITDFGDGWAKITIRHAPAEGEQPRHDRHHAAALRKV